MRAAVGMGEETKLCDACGGEYDRTLFSKKQWQARGQRRCADCVSQGRPARYTDAYRPRVPGHSKLDFMLGQEELIEHAIRAAAQETGYSEGTEMEQVIEEMTQLARQEKERFIRQMRLYYYKQVLLEDLASAGLPYEEGMIMRRAVYFLPEDGFTLIVGKVRRAMSKGKAKLRKVCKEVFLSVDRNVTIKFDDDKETREAALKTRIAASDGSGGRAMDLPEVRAYAERSFASCSVTYPVDMLSGDSARAIMQRKLHAIISRAEEDGRLREIDWGSEPTPNLDPEEVAQETAADGFVPSIERLVYDLVPMLRPEPSDHIDRLLNKASNGTPLTSEQRNHPDWIKLARRFFDFYVGSKKNDGIDVRIFNRCVERQRDEFRQQRYKPTDPGLPLRRRCDLCYVDNALAEWRYPYCTSCNVYWLSPNFRRMDRLNRCCPICLLPPKSAEFSYTLRCGHTLHLKCLEYAKSVRAECPGENILSVCPVCSDPITDDLEKVVFVQDVWPTHMGLWPGAPDPHDVAFVAERAAKGAYLAASAAVRDAKKKVSDAIAMGVWEDIWRGREADTDSLGASS